MEDIKSKLRFVLFILGFLAIIFGIGFIKYKIWRAEHPNAKTWTFFIPKG